MELWKMKLLLCVALVRMFKSVLENNVAICFLSFLRGHLFKSKQFQYHELH
jgi:hypothetical protein